MISYFTSVAPPVSLTIHPPASVITVADVAPFNNYTIACTASLPSELQFFTMNLSWIDMAIGQPIQANSSIQIQTFSTSMVLGGESIVVYNSVLMAREMTSGSYNRLCRADVTYRDLTGTQQVITYQEVATAYKTIQVRGKLFFFSFHGL